MSVDPIVFEGRELHVEPTGDGAFVVRDAATGIVRGEFETVDTGAAELSYWAGDDLELVRRVAWAFLGERRGS